MAHCRDCGQEIDWMKTKNNKNVPVDIECISIDEAEDADLIINDNGTMGKAQILKQDAYNQECVWYVVHFSTCPKAERRS